MLQKIITSSLLWLCVFSHSVFAEGSCGLDRACEVGGLDGGTYYLGFPADWDKTTPLIPFVFFHGHNGSGKRVIKNKGMVSSLTKRGYLVIAPDGPLFKFSGRSTRGWAARPEGEAPRGNRDDIAFVENVLADVGKQFPVRLKDTIVSGFSSGGSMAWYFSCYSKLPLAGIVAVAGGLRRPLPEGGLKQADGSIATKCQGGPRNVIHIHGFADRQVPLEGRGIRAWHQGDVFEGLSVQRHTNQCGSRPDAVESKGDYWCRTWTSCDSGQPIRFCLHAGGHGMPKGWLDQGLKWLDRP